MNEPITMELWENHVKVNCRDSYGLAVCLAALLIAEHPESDPEEMLSTIRGLSGFQASGALSIAEQIKPLFAKGVA